MSVPSSPPPSFRMLMEAHAPLVWSSALRAGVRDADVPEVADDVFLVLRAALDERRLDTSKPLKGWLRRVTYWKARAWLRQAHVRKEKLTASGEVEMNETAPSPEDALHEKDVHAQVHAILDELPPDLRIVLAMSDLDDMPMSEIIEVLEIPEGTGYSRLRAARRAFKATWGERRAMGHAAVLPFALWGADDMLRAARPVPDVPAGAMDELRRRMDRALAAAGAATGAAGAAAGTAGVAKGTIALTMGQAVVGVVVAMLAGAVGLAAARAFLDWPAAPVVVVAEQRPAPSAPAPGVAGTTPEPLAAEVPEQASSAEPAGDAGTHAQGGEAATSERTLLRNADAAIRRGDVAAARAALHRLDREFRNGRLMGEREDLRRRLGAYQDGGP